MPERKGLERQNTSFMPLTPLALTSYGNFAKKYPSPSPPPYYRAAITRHDGRAVDIYPEIRSMPRTMNVADFGAGEASASAMAVDEQTGRTTPEVATVVETTTTKEEVPAITTIETAPAEAVVSAATSASSTADAEDVVAETVAPGTAR
ncbi:hypothetical protein EMPG_14489 [Blastomyces silverae]|uniref:Uncharacterized protein n=1 Tax=Blastomyces silverae TaxID=2060906 RepID=A0A0H1BF71_9EURO|nr:hypothetical protein EMPG_14489 [Blastomyces silverae]